jgi:hypothetical protein
MSTSKPRPRRRVARELNARKGERKNNQSLSFAHHFKHDESRHCSIRAAPIAHRGARETRTVNYSHVTRSFVYSFQTERNSNENIEIDHNFSRAHRIVTSRILPIVEQYAEHSKVVWEGSKVCDSVPLTNTRS